MSDELLPYYNDELAFIRSLGAEFAEAHPEIAGNLRMSGDQIEDPHVSRLIESFAYLAARTRHKIDDDFPEISESFLNVLYPHFLAPFPSAAIARFDLDRAQIDATEGHAVKTGTALEYSGCRFRTCYPVHIWPIEVSLATLHSHPTPAPTTRFSQESEAVIRLQLSSYSSKVPISEINANTLRFFIQGQSQHQYPLYELLFNELLGVAVASSPDSDNVHILPEGAIKPVGFGVDEGLIDYSAQSFAGYRLLTEFFAFPDKFLFFDIEFGEHVRAQMGEGQHMELFFFLRKHMPELEPHVDKSTFQMGCSPIINLFRQTAEAFRVDHSVYRHRILPDARRPDMYEIFSVDEVRAISPSEKKTTFSPFYSTRHGAATDESTAYWYGVREESGAGSRAGTEVYLSLVDLQLKPYEELEEWTVTVGTTCFNRNVPEQFSGEIPMQVSDGGAVIQDSRAICITAPTDVLRPERRRGTLWKLISHLSLNHLSLVDNERGAEALREILSLYDLRNSPATRRNIDALSSVESKRVVRSIVAARQGGHHGFCRGTQVTLTIDEEKMSGGNLFLFAAVIERFLGLYTSINSFTQTLVRTDRREGYLHHTPPPARAGERLLS